LLVSRLEEGYCRIVVNGFGVHGFDYTQVIGNGGCIGQQFAEPAAALPVLIEVNPRSGERESRLIGCHSGQSLPHPDACREFLALHFAQFGFPVEQFELGRCTALEQVNYPLGFWCEVWQIGEDSICAGIRGVAGIAEQLSEGHTANTQGRTVKECPAVQVQVMIQFFHITY
jgi:hypothetical protein